jgi:predicted MPP superfamily phosphohydrolase
MRAVSDKRRIKELKSRISILTGDTPCKFHIMNISMFVESVRLFLKWSKLETKGFRNAMEIALVEETFEFPDLPREFDGFKILLITDLHIDGIPALPEKILEKALPLKADICLFGGDYRFYNCGNTRNVCDRMKSFANKLSGTGIPVAAVLGNHDEYEIARELDGAGVKMLINENLLIDRNGASLCICGVDDCHYYGSHDIRQSLAGVPNKAFRILLCHSPELYAEAEQSGFRLYLAGHTHGGQICPMPGKPILIQAKIPGRLAAGAWTHGRLKGYTSRGAGSSGVPARFNCPPEIALITLKAGVKNNE